MRENYFIRDRLAIFFCHNTFKMLEEWTQFWNMSLGLIF